MSAAGKQILFSVVFFIVGIFVGIMINQSMSSVPNLNSSKLAPVQKNQIDNKLFTTQQATVMGKITKVNGKKITVENIFKQKGELDLADQVTIFKFDPRVKTASTSTDLKDVRLNAEVIINLNYLNGKFYVFSIANRPPDPSPPSNPSIASSASKLKRP